MNTPLSKPRAAGGVRLRGVRKAWRGHVAIDALDLTVEAGTFVALLGPSGCGKSTTLRLIAGLEQADAGTIEIDGRNATHLPPAERGLSMVFQSYALFPHLTVAQNIVFGMTVRKVAKDERARRLDQVAEMTGLRGLLDRKPSELSGGQRQRVALARALAAGHRLCLMDEPLSNLDARLRLSVRQEIRSLQRELAMTVIYVTHDQTEAMGMADHVVLMNAGRIEQQGTPRELYERPASSFAATFIGSPAMMLFPQNQVPTNLRPTGSDSSCVLGVRPEHLRLVADIGSAVGGTVVDREFQGADAYVHVRPDGGNPIIVRTSDVDDALAVPGARVGLSWPLTQTHVFDAVTGARRTV